MTLTLLWFALDEKDYLKKNDIKSYFLIQTRIFTCRDIGCFGK